MTTRKHTNRTDRLPMNVRGRRPRFFPAPGTDELVSVMLEMASELWTVKERLYAVEQLAQAQGIELGERLEAYQFEPAEQARLETERRRFLGTLFRALDSEYVERRALQAELDLAMRSEQLPAGRDDRSEAA